MAQGAVDKASRTAAVGMVLNGGLMVAKLATGVLGHSYALVADGVESLTDLLASVIVWRGIRTAARDPDSRHPFGYGKAESVSAAAVALILILAGVGICVQAVREIATPPPRPGAFHPVRPDRGDPDQTRPLQVDLRSRPERTQSRSLGRCLAPSRRRDHLGGGLHRHFGGAAGGRWLACGGRLGGAGRISRDSPERGVPPQRLGCRPDGCGSVRRDR